MPNGILEVKQIKQLSADGGGTVVDVENKTIDDVAIGGTTPAAGTFTSVDATGDVTIADKIIHSGDTDAAIRFPAADTVTVETSGAERMRIDSSGDVLIGTTTNNSTPASLLVSNNNNTNYALATKMEIAGSGGHFYNYDQLGNVIFNIGQSGTDGDAVLNAKNSMKFATGGSERMTIDSSGNVSITGSLSKGSGSFKIDHPLKPETHHLVHSFVEAPQADNIYRGKVDLVAGYAEVNIDTAAGMTEGTFVAINREIQCFTSNESDWDAVRGSVSGNLLTIECKNPESTATVSWMVIGERQDQHMKETNWTDENGKVIVEPLKQTDEQTPA